MLLRTPHDPKNADFWPIFLLLFEKSFQKSQKFSKKSVYKFFFFFLVKNKFLIKNIQQRK